MVIHAPVAVEMPTQPGQGSRHPRIDKPCLATLHNAAAAVGTSNLLGELHVPCCVASRKVLDIRDRGGGREHEGINSAPPEGSKQ